ncbi:MAG: CxxC-x17-CxxC domain-containing protein [Nanoarchaeota archaeon]
MNFRDGPRQMFDATCSKCQKACKVPFQPKSGRPVFCLDCFKASKNEQQA